VVQVQGRKDILNEASGLDKALRISSGVLGLLLCLPLAIAAWAVSVLVAADSQLATGDTWQVTAVIVAVALVVIVLFLCSIRTLVRATSVTLFVLAGCELIVVVLLIIAMRSGSNLLALTVIAGIAVVISVLTGMRVRTRSAV
jgi:FtsH-binding integral membrane protein